MKYNLIELGFSKEQVSKLSDQQINILFQYYNGNEIINMDKIKILQGLDIFCKLIGIDNNSVENEQNLTDTISDIIIDDEQKEFYDTSINDRDSFETSIQNFIAPLGYKEKIWALMLIKSQSTNQYNFDDAIAQYSNEFKQHTILVKKIFAEIKSGKPINDVLNDPQFAKIKKEFLSILQSLKNVSSETEVKTKLIREIQKQPTREIELFYLKILNALSPIISDKLKYQMFVVTKQWPTKNEVQIQKELKKKIIENF